ncbi:hypothetical protein WAI453_007151 [Rhynchosporium graminicola]
MFVPQKALEAIILLHNQSAEQKPFSPHSDPSYFCVVEILSGILNTNAFCQNSHVGKIGMLLLVGSMFIHSDKPNIDRALDDASEKLIFKSNRDIKKGEDLEIDYCPDLSAESKGKWMKDRYGIL